MDQPPSPPRQARAYDMQPILASDAEGRDGSDEGTLPQMVFAVPLDDLSTLGEGTFTRHDFGARLGEAQASTPPRYPTEVVQHSETPRRANRIFPPRSPGPRHVYLSPQSIFNDELGDGSDTITTLSTIERRGTTRKVYCFALLCGPLLLGSIIGMIVGLMRFREDSPATNNQKPLAGLLNPPAASFVPTASPTEGIISPAETNAPSSEPRSSDPPFPWFEGNGPTPRPTLGIAPITAPTSHPTRMTISFESPNAPPNANRPRATPSPSAKPTLYPLSPTPLPVVPPVAAPTTRPVVVPVASPTPKPTPRPSPPPTPRPGPLPTFTPGPLPTPRPDPLPTPRPDPSPTPRPSIISTRRPEASPTEFPVAPPNRAPVLSKKPSPPFTAHPTATPNRPPTSSPTADPTEMPTAEPTEIPTAEPRENPHRPVITTLPPFEDTVDRPLLEFPTSETDPRDNPARSPTTNVFPSADLFTDPPSLEISAEPIKSNSDTPIAIPSQNPSGVPSKVLSLEPSADPTAVIKTNHPMGRATTAGPSHGPSFNPTDAPSDGPNVVPSDRPTSDTRTPPSLESSTHPTVVPSGHPTVSFSDEPTLKPSDHPTTEHSSYPTDKSSDHPTVARSHEPTATISEPPTAEDSANPTIASSHEPIAAPSNDPTSEASMHPTVAPSHEPTVTSSELPTAHDSAHPTIVTSSEPSTAPSDYPTSEATLHPTIASSHAPSVTSSELPTAHDSAHPTIVTSSEPSAAPSGYPKGETTLNPTVASSHEPTVTSSEPPTDEDSAHPTLKSSANPSSYPSVIPSLAASENPTMVATDVPSSKPSPLPSPGPTATPEYPSIKPSESTYTVQEETFYPQFRFVQWQDLHPRTQALAGVAGYDEQSWDHPGMNSIETVQYSQLSHQLQTIMERLGFQTDLWDCWINHYRGYSWDELVGRGVVRHYEILGWTEAKWNSRYPLEWPESDRQQWYDLTGEQRLAAEELCYTQELWDEILLPSWSSIRDARNDLTNMIEARSTASLNAIVEDVDSPQHRAYLWLTSNRHNWNYNSDRLIQRWVLAVMALGLGETRGVSGGNGSMLQLWVGKEDECAKDAVSSADLDPAICNSNGLVEELVLTDVNLFGTLPLELSLLSNSLKSIHMPGNNLYGFLPTELGKLSLLERLELGTNRLEGTIPSEIANIDTLEILNLEHNNLVGNIPDELGSVPARSSMRQLFLEGNEIDGFVPQSLGLVSTLEVLSLGTNNLSGTMPHDICDLPLLDELLVDCEKVACPCCTNC